MSRPTPINRLLDSLIAAKGWKGRVELHGVFDFWDDVVGDDIAARAQPLVIRKTILWVRVSDSVWMQQLHLLKEMILEKLNQRLKKKKITDLRFQLDSSLGEQPVQSDPSFVAPEKPKPDQKRLEEFERLLETIEDQDIKDAMRRCWLKVGQLHETD